MSTSNPQNEIILYQPDNSIKLEVRLEEETVWLSQAQMVDLFQRDVSVISRHINNIFMEGELDKKSNLHFLQIAFSDRPVLFYSLDVVDDTVYHIGASLKDLGKKLFAFSKMETKPAVILHGIL